MSVPDVIPASKSNVPLSAPVFGDECRRLSMSIQVGSRYFNSRLWKKDQKEGNWKKSTVTSKNFDA